MFRRVIAAIAFAIFGLFVALGSSVVAQTGSPQPSTDTTQPSITQPSTGTTQPSMTQPATGNTQPSTRINQLGEIDRQYILSAGEAGLASIQMGQLALQRATSDQVKQFAQAEIDEQVNVKNQLSQIAPRVGVALPTAPGLKYQASLRRLSQLSGNQFNQAYMSEGGVNAHLEIAAIFQREAAFGQNPELVRVANNGLPTINNHFTTASALTNYRFAQVPVRFNNIPNNTSAVPSTPSQNVTPTSSTMSAPQ